MKRSITNLAQRMFLVALILMIGFSNSFANGEEAISKKILEAFKSEFVNAGNPNWENTRSFAKVTFTLGGQVMFAYYSFDGTLLAATRNITSSQLPITLLSDLKKEYAQYWISDLFELSNENGTTYFLTVENGDQSVVLKASGIAGWTIFKKDRK